MTAQHSASSPASAPDPARAAGEVTVLVYSDDRAVRDNVRLGLGTHIAADLPKLRVVEAATQAGCVNALEAGGIDLAILDGEATPLGGMGLCRELKDEIYQCPPVLVIVMREQDAWLATWSRADGAIMHPVDPRTLANATATLLRRRLAVAAS